MRKLLLTLCLAALAVSAAGCGSVGGPRFWYDDRNQQRIDDYDLPMDPAAPADYGTEGRVATPSGDDLSEDDLRDYRTNIDQEEEKRKSEASLLDF